MHAAKITGGHLFGEPQTAPLSFSQQRLRGLASPYKPGQLHPAAAVRWNGPIDPDGLKRSANEIVRRHATLQTVFSFADTGDTQVVSAPLSAVMAVEDVSRLARENREREVRERIRIILRQPFNVESGPLMKMALFRLQDEEHILLVDMHPLIADEASTGIFLQELTKLYTAEIEHKRIPLPALSTQYLDHVLWEQSPVRAGRIRESLGYWKKQLEGAPELMKLPSDLTPGSLTKYAAGSETFSLPLSFKTALSAFSEAEGVDPSLTFLAAFGALLFRYTQQEDLVVGLSVDGRESIESADLIAPFANTLPFRVRLSGDPTFRELLRWIQRTWADAHENLYVPAELCGDRKEYQAACASDSPFQVTFGYRQTPADLALPRGVRISTFDLESSSGPDLALVVHDHPNGVRIAAKYDSRLFRGSTVLRWMGQFQVLLEGIIANPDQRVASLPLLTEQERHQVLLGWNDTAADYPTGACIHQLFEKQAALTPNAIAVVFEGQQLTYRELNRRATRAAFALRAADVWPEVLVGICLERSLEMVVGLLAILKAGGAYVPIDPSYPSERIAFMLEDSSVAVLLTSKALAPKMPAINATVLCLDTLDDQPFDEDLDSWASLAGPENLAYVIYTSGSTGRPKGVQISHRSVVNFLNSMLKRPGLTRDDVLLSVTTLSFDIAALEIYLPLTVGARVVIATRETAMDPRELMAKVERSQCTVLQATPATWRVLIQAGWSGSSKLNVLCGGDAMTRELAADLLPRSQSVWNMYGPTETTIWSSVSQIHDAVSPIRIGRPIDNTQMYILDANRNPAPVGVPGELYIGGDGLSPGYLNRPALTEERFVPNPFQTGEKLYRTGDSARYMPNGEIECLGRIDNQVKIRGFRLELGEIEAVLMENPDVLQAVVVARDDAKFGKRLIAYFSSARPGLHTAELAAYLRSRLPAQMVPSMFIPLDTIPLTPNGKVDRARLLSLEPQQSQRADVAAPADDVESRLQDIWCDVLDLEYVSMTDNFFDVGGHSLLSVPLFAKIDSEFNVQFPIVTLCHAPTIRTMAQLIREPSSRAAIAGGKLFSAFGSRKTVLTKSGLAIPADPRNLISIQADGTRAPFFMVGADYWFRPLARHVGLDQPFVGVPLVTYRQINMAEERVSIAQQLARFLIAERGGTPFFIGGWCDDGLIALEVARALREQGESIGLLVLFDTVNPDYYRQLNGWIHSLGRTSTSLRVVIGAAIQAGFMAGMSKLAKTLVSVARRVVGRFRNSLTRDYSSRPVSFSVLVLRPPGGPLESPDLGWGSVCQDNLTVAEVPGDHDSMFREPNVRVLGLKLREQLDLAIARIQDPLAETKG